MLTGLDDAQSANVLVAATASHSPSRISAKVPAAPTPSMATSTALPVRDGSRAWCASSRVAQARLTASATSYDQALAATLASGAALPPERQRELDTILLRAERAFTRPEGLPRRPWYRHQIYAPGFYTGYGVKTLPAVREAIEEGDYREAAEQIGVVARAIEAYAAEVDRAAALLGGAQRD